MRRLTLAGIPLDGASDHGVSEALYLRDPDNNGIELYWDRPRDAWPRNADGSVNPYLAATLALAAGLEGIREKIDPGKPNEDNLYEMSEAQRLERGIQFLPQTLQEAVAAFAADPLVEQTLGSELRNEFVFYKSQEWQEYHLSITQWEIDRYSHMF